MCACVCAEAQRSLQADRAMRQLCIHMYMYLCMCMYCCPYPYAGHQRLRKQCRRVSSSCHTTHLHSDALSSAHGHVRVYAQTHAHVVCMHMVAARRTCAATRVCRRTGMHVHTYICSRSLVCMCMSRACAWHVRVHSVPATHSCRRARTGGRVEALHPAPVSAPPREPTRARWTCQGLAHNPIAARERAHPCGVRARAKACFSRRRRTGRTAS